jgi:hypothetical protein
MRLEFDPDSFGSVNWELPQEAHGGFTLILHADPLGHEQHSNWIPSKIKPPGGAHLKDHERAHTSPVCYRPRG